MQGKTLPRTEKTTEKSRTKFSTGIWEIGSRGKDLAAKNTANAPAEIFVVPPIHPVGQKTFLSVCLTKKKKETGRRCSDYALNFGTYQLTL